LMAKSPFQVRFQISTKVTKARWKEHYGVIQRW